VTERQPDEAPSSDPIDPQQSEPSEESVDARFWREMPVLILIALVIAIALKTLVVQAFVIPSESMRPTLQPGDRVLVCRICGLVDGVDRGDIVVFSDPSPGAHHDRGVIGGLLHFLGEGLGVASPQDEDFIKRVIGLPGDVVELHDGEVFVNGRVLDEPYLSPNIDTRPFGPVTVPDGMLFVLGDNRTRSGDSRFPPPQGLGYVPQDKVIGVAFVKVWPPDRIGGL
jgi:signal peptidase I